MTREQILQEYDLNEKSKENMWCYSIRLEFVDRKFELACASTAERKAWLRAFGLFIKMNQS